MSHEGQKYFYPEHKSTNHKRNYYMEINQH